MASIKVSRLHLVDLAGSERQKDTHAEGLRLKVNFIYLFIYFLQTYKFIKICDGCGEAHCLSECRLRILLVYLDLMQSGWLISCCFFPPALGSKQYKQIFVSSW